jgi:predicted transcriptional regulator of viral defense system
MEDVTICSMSAGQVSVRAPELADWLLSRGVSSLTTTAAAGYLSVPEDQVRRRLHTPGRRGQWVSPAHGLWIPVPPEYRAWGAPPGIEIIDALMGHLRARYYVGWLSAAEMYGAAHQAPQVFQVATDRQVRARQVGRTRLEFWIRTGLDDLPTIAFPTRSGSACVSTPELTMLDVASDIQLVGGIDNAATVLVELADHEQLDLARLAGLAGRFPAASVRRVGWVLEHLADSADLEDLHRAATSRSESASILDPLGPVSGPIDRRWRLRINRDVQVESW